MLRVFLHLLFILLFLMLSPINADQQEENSTELLLVDDMKIPPYARHLKGIRICLDPGHGGQGHIPDYKRGPTGLREAEINLKVAKYLQTLLEKVETSVIMTRTDDSYVSIADRSEIANKNQVDFFISLHHNGIDDKPEINYTSTWYHGDADDSRPSLDLARYLQKSVSDALQLSKSPSTGLYSDKLVVASGFGVLRLTKCPAVVCEASFYTNPEEEARLKNYEYLKREAYGYFLGIARYVEAGLPKGVLITPENQSVIESKTPTIQIRVMDGLHERGAWMLKRQQVFTNSIQVKIDGKYHPFHYDRETDIITLEVKEPLSNGIHYVQTELVNYYGNHSLPKPQVFKVAPPAAILNMDAWSDTIPHTGNGYVGIVVSAYDMDGMPIANGEIIKAKTSVGTLANMESHSKNGKSYFYLTAPNNPGYAVVEASYGDTHNSKMIYFTDIGNGIVQGRVVNATTGDPISNVNITTELNITTVSDLEGHYFVKTDPTLKYPFETICHFTKQGFYPHKYQTIIEQNQPTIINVSLYPIADRAFNNINIVIDSQTDTNRTQELISSLEEMLILAGAKVFNIHIPGQIISTEERIKKVNNIKEEGYYLQINHTERITGEPSVIAKHNRGNRDTEYLQKRVLAQFNNKLYKTPIETIQDRDTPIIQQTNKSAMTLEIRSLKITDVSAQNEAFAIFLGIWQFLKDETKIEAEKIDRFKKHLNRIRGNDGENSF